MNYYKRHWNETTGDELTDSWGTSTYYFEADEDHFPIRQIELFQNGKVLKYGKEHISDDFGFLGDQPLDSEEFESFKIDKNEFEKVWNSCERAL